MNDEAERETREIDVETVDGETDETGAGNPGPRDRETLDRAAGEPPDDAPPQELEERVRELEARIEETQDQLLRKQAELINYRKRVERERVELSTRARAELLREFLPIVDDFERAVGADAEDLESYREGVELILRGIESLMSRMGVERISPEGEPFDPEYHEAMARVESDEASDGHVVEVYQPGYVMGQRLLRPARVVVAVSADDDGTDAGDGADG